MTRKQSEDAPSAPAPSGAATVARTRRRVCPWCGQSERVVSGRWALHIDSNIVPKGSTCDGAGNDYKPRQYVVKHDGLGFNRGL